MSGMLAIPLFMFTDSYKISHPYQYPDARKMVAYGEFRIPFDNDKSDARILFYGIRYIIENYVGTQWTEEDVEKADTFFKTHNAGYTHFQFPKDLFLKFIRKNNGYFPVKIEALPEGTVIYPHVPVYQITAENEYARLCTFLETVLTMVWYPTTVATLSRRSRDVLTAAYHRTVDDDAFWSLGSRLHDFGFRGCTSVEQSVIGGTAHLINFEGTDTLTAAYYAQFNLNNGSPVGTSIPATEHSVMMSFRTEREAIINMMQQFGQGVYAIVMDTYNYAHALDAVLPTVASVKTKAGGFLVVRPDSGDPVEVVLKGLMSIDKIFGSTVNRKGFKVINNCGIIQGDGVSYDLIGKIIHATEKAGYSAENVALGMGGGLLQKVNRDTMSFATKLCHITYTDGRTRDVMKYPKTAKSKCSLPGEFIVLREPPDVGIPTVHSKQAVLETEAAFPSSPSHKIANLSDASDHVAVAGNLLKIVYDHKPVLFGTARPNSKLPGWDSFDTIRERARKEWENAPKTADVISLALRERSIAVIEEMELAVKSEQEK